MIFNLSTDQKESINEFVRNSFISFCDRCGHDPHSYNEYHLKMLKYRNACILKELDPDTIQFRESYEKIFLSNDLLECRSIEHELRRSFLANDIISTCKFIKLPKDYFKKLHYRNINSDDFKLDDAFLEQVVTTVPIYSSFEPKFNAFVTSSSLLLGDVPAICVNEQLLAVCDVFVHYTFPKIFNFGERSKPIKQDLAKELGNNPDNIMSLENIFRMLIGVSGTAPSPENEKNVALNMTLSLVVESSVQFVWYHEFGHFLLGHLESSHSHKNEFEADSFAYQTLLHVASDIYGVGKFWVLFGGIVPLLLIDLLEKILRIESQSSHPSGIDRIDSWLQLTKRVVNQRQFSLIIEFIQSLYEFCKPTIKKNYSIELTTAAQLCAKYSA